jgi:hypothetical protein
MNGARTILRFALRGFAAGVGVVLVVVGFSAYLEPGVFLPAMNLLALCR